MNSEIRVYRQKKVDQLLRNLERCNKILENIQKIDTYIQQQGGSADVVTNLIGAVTNKQREMRAVPAYRLPDNTQIVRDEDIQKQNEIIEQFKTLATAVSKLVNTRVKAPTGPTEASQDPFNPLDVEFKTTEQLEAEYKEAVKNNAPNKEDIKAQLTEYGFDDGYFAGVQQAVEEERQRELEAERQRQETERQQREVTVNPTDDQPVRGSTESQDPIVPTESQDTTTVNPTGTVTREQLQDQLRGTLNPRGSTTDASGSTTDARGPQQQSQREQQQQRNISSTGTGNTSRNKYFYQNYY